MKCLFRNLYILLFLYLAHPLFSDKPKSIRADSLRHLISIEKSDSLKLRYTLDLAYTYINNNPDSAYYYIIYSLGEAQKKHLQKTESRALSILGIYYENKGEYQKSLDNYLKSLKINEALKNEAAVSSNNNNIGLVFLNMGNYKLALEYYTKALNYNLKVNNKQDLANLYNNIGIVYCSQNQLDTCLAWQMKSIELKRELGDKNGLATSLDNIGQIYFHKGKKEESLLYFTEAKRLKEEINDKFGLCVTYLNISQSYRDLKDFSKSLEYDEKVLALATFLKSKPYKQYAYRSAAATAYEMKNYKAAYDYFSLYSITKDSILNEENGKSMQELQARYESEKKDNQINLLNADNLLKQSDIKKQQIINWAIGGGLLIMIISSVIVYRSYNEKKKANVLLEEKNSAINQQNKIISEKKKEIEDSINYARYIQQSILPEVDLFDAVFKERLLLYMPKDIVSGDFYFLQHNESKKNVWLAAVDCTGHGVPGGFMSVIGAEAFEQGIRENQNSPGAALSFINNKIKKFLKQQDLKSNSKDGMDAALCYLNNSTNELIYAGANRPLFIMRNHELIQYSPTKSALGGSTETSQVFTEHKIQLQKNDTVFMFTDGYADQFGGEKGKKMTTKNFKNLLVSISDKSLQEQELLLKENLLKWKGEIEQLDDVLVLGFKIVD